MSVCGERFRLIFARSLFGATNSCVVLMAHLLTLFL